MGGVVVEHHVDRFVGRHLTLDGIEKADELLMPVAPLNQPVTLTKPPRSLRANSVAHCQLAHCQTDCSRAEFS